MRWSKSFSDVAKRPSAVWFGGIWLFVGTILLTVGLGVGVHSLRLQERMAREARVAEGMVLNKWISRRRGSQRGENTNYWVGYRFTAKNGVLVKGEAQVSRARWDQLVEREPVQVMYLPDEPGTHRIEGETSTWVLPLVFTGLGFTFASIGGVIVFKGLAGARRQRAAGDKETKKKINIGKA
jgi:hypothetical protein